MQKIKELAAKDEVLACAVIGQAILDEAKIGPETIRISYYSEDEARHLWDIGRRWNLVNNLRIEKAHGADRWVFTVRADARQKLYDAIGKLPNPSKDRAFRHLIGRDAKGGRWKYRLGGAKAAILDLLKEPKTVREICESAGLGSSTVRKHLKTLEKLGKVRKIGRNVSAVRKNFRLAELWSASVE